MREVISSGFTPQRKIIGVNKNYGNSGIKRQQGSTVILYDTLDITIDSTYRFFEGANNRDFPLTNVGASGNKLPVGGQQGQAKEIQVSPRGTGLEKTIMFKK